MAKKENHLVGLDVGTSKVAAIVAEPLDDGGIDITGVGVVEAQGIKRGVVVNLEAAVESIKKAIEEAELTAGVEIDSVAIGLSGAHLKAFNSRGVVAVADRHREINRGDVRRAIDAAKAVTLPAGPRDRAPPRPGLHGGRPGRDQCAGRHDRVPPRGQRARGHRQHLDDPEHHRLREPGGGGGRRHVHRAARGERVGADHRRTGSGRGAGRYRRGHDRPRHLRARQSLAYRRRDPRRRPLHERRRGRAADADSRPPRRPSACRGARSTRWSTRTSASRWRASGGGRRGRCPGACCPGFCNRGPSSCSTSCGTRYGAPATRIPCIPASCCAAARPCWRGCRRSPSRSSTCRFAGGARPGVGGLTDHVNSPAFATGVGLVKHAHRRQMQEQVRESWWNVDRSLGGRLRGLLRFLGRARGRSWA